MQQRGTPSNLVPSEGRQPWSKIFRNEEVEREQHKRPEVRDSVSEVRSAKQADDVAARVPSELWKDRYIIPDFLPQTVRSLGDTRRS